LRAATIKIASKIKMKAIGTVKSCYPDKFGTPRQPGLVPQSKAFLELNPQWQPEQSLQGLEGYSHLWVIFEFHKNTHERFHAKVHPPRLKGESVGVFATRSPHRPNSIGLSLVKIESVEETGVWVSGIDLIDGTPILDLKPYLPEIESRPQASSGWAGEVQNLEIQFIWPEPALADLKAWCAWRKKESLEDLKALIEATLKLDPRPVVYRGYEGQDSKHRDEHALRIWDGDVHFKFVESARIQVSSIVILKLKN
jgi:tRNA-Thr(GGU) m(6)t(6)A37 methyltransferase TsaA